MGRTQSCMVSQVSSVFRSGRIHPSLPLIPKYCKGSVESRRGLSGQEMGKLGLRVKVTAE